MGKRVLYLGDTGLTGAAAYLAGIMNFYELKFDYVPSARPFSDSCQLEKYAVVIISDYPAANFTISQLQQLDRAISGGAGLLMIGGWESFVGLAGGYQNTSLAKRLPVQLFSSDDRQNHWGPCVVQRRRAHPIVDGLPLDRDLPCVGGFNRVVAKPGAQTLLTVQRFLANVDGDRVLFEPGESHPLLVVTAEGVGRIACFTSDVAPHWVGGLVDWGDRRISAQAPGANEIEVGDTYASLFANLIRWVGKIQ